MAERSPPSTETGSSTPMFVTPVSVDALFELFAHPARRYIVSSLLDRESASTYELVEQALDENATSDSFTEGDVRGRLLRSFDETHLPELSAAGLVEYDPDQDHVEPTAAARSVEPFLELARQYQQEYARQATGSRSTDAR